MCATRREFVEWSWAAWASAMGGGMPSVAVLAGSSLLASEPTHDEAGGSHIGSLFPFVRSQVVRDWPLSFLAKRFTDPTAWRDQARSKFLELLHYSPAPAAADARILSRDEEPDHFRERIEFSTTADLRVPAFVLVPKGLREPAPAIVALHDHGGFYLWGKEKLIALPGEHAALAQFRHDAYAGRSIAVELVRRGYVVIVIDMFYWGDRRLLLDGDDADWKDRPADMTDERVTAFNNRSGSSEELVGRTIETAGFTWPGVIFWDDIRTVDYLVTRPDVDPSRLGCVGLSVGGLRAGHLAALDERIKAAVVVGWMTSFPAQLARHVIHTIGMTKLVPGLLRSMDYPDVVAMTLPRPLLVIHGKHDQLFAPQGVQAAAEKLRGSYAKAQAADAFRFSEYDSPHEFNLDMQSEAWDWLARHVVLPA